MASITQVLTAIGSGSIGVQYLKDCMSRCDQTGKKTEVTFATTVSALDMLDDKKTAVILWVDPKEWQNAQDSLKSDESKGANGECTLTGFNKSDYVTHHGDWEQACRIAMQCATSEDDRTYWQRQLNTLDRLAKDYPHE